MTTLMRNGRDRRSGKPVMGHAILERALLVGTRSADHIRASGHSGCIATGRASTRKNRPDTWLHPNASQIGQIPLAPRAPSIHGPSRQLARRSDMSGVGGKPEVPGGAVGTTDTPIVLAPICRRSLRNVVAEADHDWYFRELHECRQRHADALERGGRARHRARHFVS